MSFPPRAGFSTKLPDRQTTNFGQSAPTYTRRDRENAPTNTYNTYGGNAPGPTGPAQQQQQQQQYSSTIAGPSNYRAQQQQPEKDSNLLHELSDEQRAEINEAFSLFDVDKDRHLDYHELRVALRALGFTLPKNEALTLIQSLGVPKPSARKLAVIGTTASSYHASQLLIPQNAFTRLAAQKIHERDPREEVERAFHLFDDANKGYISLDDLRRVTRELGENSLEEQELANMIEEFDYEGVGGVSKDAFFGICLQ